MENQLTILSESLDKKLSILNEIQEYNKKQEKCFLEEKVKLSEFDAAIEEKSKLIEQLTRLDEGFETVYAKLKEELNGNREQYKVQIGRLQDKIRQVTEMGLVIQAQEQRNKKLVERYFARKRSDIRQDRKNSKAAYDYYKSMSGASVNPPQFLDSKK